MIGRSVMALIASSLVLTGFADGTSGLEPGDHVGTMRLVKGTVATADLKLFDFCDPIVRASGKRARRCGVVPRARRLFIGYGSFALPDKINDLWVRTRWTSWIDGRRIELAKFGSSDRTLYAFPPAGGKDATLREWRVILVKAVPGRHKLRYRSTGPDGTIDTTWLFTVAGN